jgi:hypothetical protein
VEPANDERVRVFDEHGERFREGCSTDVKFAARE